MKLESLLLEGVIDIVRGKRNSATVLNDFIAAVPWADLDNIENEVNEWFQACKFEAIAVELTLMYLFQALRAAPKQINLLAVDLSAPMSSRLGFREKLLAVNGGYSLRGKFITLQKESSVEQTDEEHTGEEHGMVHFVNIFGNVSNACHIFSGAIDNHVDENPTGSTHLQGGVQLPSKRTSLLTEKIYIPFKPSFQLHRQH